MKICPSNVSGRDVKKLLGMFLQYFVGKYFQNNYRSVRFIRECWIILANKS